METLNILNSKGVRVTHQRMAVYRALQKMGHAAAEDIFNEVKSDYPMISFATVYSILQVFKKENLISEMKIDFGKSTFDIRVDNHHHFMCRRCGKIYDIDIADSDVAFSTWSPETFIADCLEKDTYVYDNGLKRVPPFSGYEEIEVPIFGRQPFWYHAHEEQVTLWRFIGKKVNKVEFKIGGPATEFVYNLYLNGLLNRDAIEYNGCKITPLDFYLKIVPRPPTEEELRKWIDEGLLRDAKEVVVTEVWGWRDGDYYHYKYTIIGPSIKDIIKKVPPANHSSYLVSGGCYLLVRMIADGMIRERGVIVPEQINRDARIRYVKDHSRVLDPSVEIRLEIEATLSK